ncbi:serine acetyltransferase [Prevotella copri]|nr:serine acetyltransferase [Segatella copri]
MVIGEVVIGDYVKIGAGAVVVKNVPPNSVVAGVPAKVIKKF